MDKMSEEDNKIKKSEIEKSEIKESNSSGENIIKEKKIIEYFKKENINNYVSKTTNFLKQKKVQIIITSILILAIIILGSLIRLENLPLLKDSTTGEYIPLALDPFYFLRIAETINQQGSLPAIDTMRFPSAQIKYSNEILPQTTIFLYKFINIFDKNVSLRFVNILFPVIFFVLGLIIFFFLIYILTKSKTIALISSFFLTIIPPYLYRTMAGFSDHETIGIFAFFLTLLCYGLSLKFLDKEEEKDRLFIKSCLGGLLVGFISAFTIASWGGISNFVFIIIPASFLLFWIIKTKNIKEIKVKSLYALLIFYLIFFVSTILFGLIYGFSFFSLLNKISLTSSSFINGGVLLFLIIDILMIKLKGKINFIKKEILEKYRILFSLLIVIILGCVFFSFYEGGIFSFVSKIMEGFLHPFGAQRVGLTVAENTQPYLIDWINQVGKIFFWLFYIGVIFVGINLSEGINKKKNKVLFAILWIVMISGILFSRISSTSILNGTNFLSQIVYFGSLLLFFGYCTWLYFNDKIKIKKELILLASWLLFMLIAGRGAARLFFVVTPFVCFMACYPIFKIFKYAKKSKDEILKLFLFILLVLIIIGLVISSFSFIASSVQQSKYMGPSASNQWQKAMSWVRENTLENSIFVHWWDYGYWVQYLGERPTVTDGGHAVNYWDHLIGRYLLTTPRPETALSFMKSHNVSYLLIDPSEIGKYSAYSKIGSGPEGEDRYSSIPTMFLDPKQTQETENSITRIYNGVSEVDEDIIYNSNQGEIFLPQKKALIIGTIINIKDQEIQQPEAVFFYNNKQIYIPIRYLYLKGKLTDFGKGINSIIYVLPQANALNNNLQIDNFGAMLYLSPKVSKSLFAQLYLMNDPFDNYPTLKLVHSEQDQIINILNLEGADLEMVYYNGIKGPIKIWKVNYPENILSKEEFLRTSGDYAEFDNLTFIK